MDAREAVTQSRTEFIKWAQSASLVELKNVFSECSPNGRAYMWDIAKTEIHARQHRWTLWGFLVMFLTLIFAIIAASPVIQSWYKNELSTESIKHIEPIRE